MVLRGLKLLLKCGASHYSTLLNSASKSSADNEFLLKQLQCGALFHDFSTFQCSVDEIGPLLCKLKLNCAAGTNNITAEHLCYCDDSIKFYLSVLFSLCLRHVFIPHARTKIKMSRILVTTDELPLLRLSLNCLSVLSCITFRPLCKLVQISLASSPNIIRI